MCALLGVHIVHIRKFVDDHIDTYVNRKKQKILRGKNLRKGIIWAHLANVGHTVCN